MSQPPTQHDPRVCNCPDGPPKWARLDARLQKLVLGPTPGDKDGGKQKTLAAPALPADLAARFPNLTHLYLWNLTGLKSLPPLPPKLVCLDLRGCADLAALPALPATLEALVLDGCARLGTLPEVAPGGLPRLEDLSLKGCVATPEAWLHGVLAAAPGLRWLDASGCPQWEGIPKWPRALERIELNECPNLSALPGIWPARLRRVGLRGASAVTALPDSPPGLDYLDLAHTESLQALPAELGKPRTLFLFGSGVRQPPASEHGKAADENVAGRTLAYFDDVARVGRGQVKRCKLLMLGNGGAGKTCLSLALVPGQNPADAETLGSTHGVQFWDWPSAAAVGGLFQNVHLHVWDFGGQEIYHNTHRLFMSKAAVFVVVWKPDQDGHQPKPSACGYQDEWRPLQYWLDFIHLACPHRPRIAIVCSHHAHPTDELKARLRGQLREEFHDEQQWFFVDSLHRAGELDRLKDWLAKAVGGVVETQGVEVPAYWEIAQDMAQDWVKRMAKDAAFAAAHNHLPPTRFRKLLGEAMREGIAEDGVGRYARLAEALRKKTFALTPSRVERTLEFLTHSGWVYWDRGLFEGQVIVGQQWALDGIYAVLERRADSRVFRALSRSGGRFTLAQLGEWVWNEKGYTGPVQELLRSFMEQCGLCFKLRAREETWRDQEVFVSFEHLPTARELGLERTFQRRLQDARVVGRALENPRLHQHHWQRFLTHAGAHYGKNAQYALDGFYLETEGGGRLLVLCRLEPAGLGGEIEIQVGGPAAAERLGSVVAHLEQFLPGGETGVRGTMEPALGRPVPREEVFISYTWNPPATPGESATPPGYEEPVEAIEEFLRDKPVLLIRDNRSTEFGDDLRQFMEYAAKRPHVIVVHSDKYWRSPCCIFELWTLEQELKQQKGKSLPSVVIPVEHMNSSVMTMEGLEECLKYWEGFRGTPPMLGWTAKELKDHACSLVRTFAGDLSKSRGLNLRWEDGPAKVLAEIAKRLGLSDGRKGGA